jgi:hypothetical protein
MKITIAGKTEGSMEPGAEVVFLPENEDARLPL